MSTEKRNTPPLLLAFGIFVLPLFVLSPRADGTDCVQVAQATTPELNNYYDGTLSNGDTVRAVLTFSDCVVTGSWFDSASFEDLKVRGVIGPGGYVILKMLTNRNKLITTVRGRFFTRYFYRSGSQPSEIGLDLLMGDLRAHLRSGLTTSTVILTFSNSWDSKVAEYTVDADVADRTAFNNATLRFWRAVRTHDIPIAVSCVRYPLQAEIFNPTTGTLRHFVIRNAQTLAQEYNSVFNWYTTEKIIRHLPRYMIPTANRAGFELSLGIVIFNNSGQVIRLDSAQP